jgi:hypothetical protein
VRSTPSRRTHAADAIQTGAFPDRLVGQFNRNGCIGPAQPGEMFSIQGIEESRSRQDGPCLSVTGPISEAGLEPDGAVIHPWRKESVRRTLSATRRMISDFILDACAKSTQPTRGRLRRLGGYAANIASSEGSGNPASSCSDGLLQSNCPTARSRRCLTSLRQAVLIPASKGCPQGGAETPLVRGNPLNLIRVVPA